MVQITLTTETYNKKPNTKTAYQLESTETETIDSLQYSRIVSDDTCKWFRRLGGTETAVRAYTCDGYKVVKLTSTSPDKEIKKVRKFNFKWLN